MAHASFYCISLHWHRHGYGGSHINGPAPAHGTKLYTMYTHGVQNRIQITVLYAYLHTNMVSSGAAVAFKLIHIVSFMHLVYLLNNNGRGIWFGALRTRSALCGDPDLSQRQLALLLSVFSPGTGLFGNFLPWLRLSLRRWLQLHGVSMSMASCTWSTARFCCAMVLAVTSSLACFSFAMVAPASWCVSLSMASGTWSAALLMVALNVFLQVVFFAPYSFDLVLCPVLLHLRRQWLPVAFRYFTVVGVHSGSVCCSRLQWLPSAFSTSTVVGVRCGPVCCSSVCSSHWYGIAATLLSLQSCLGSVVTSLWLWHISPISWQLFCLLLQHMGWRSLVDFNH